MEYYFKIFYESAWSASVIPFSNEATFFAMQAFGGFDMKIPVLLAVTGATLGQLFNLMLGKFLLSFYRKGQLHVSEYWYNRVSVLFNTYGIFLLLFSWVSILKVLVVLTGFVGTRTRFALPLIVLGQFYYYGH